MIASIIENYNKKVKILNNLSHFFSKRLLYTQKPLDYCLDRGFTKDTLDTFYLGYDIGVQDFLDRENEGIEEDLIKLGILTENEDNTLYDKFYDRIIFPIFDISGNVVGLSGRIWKKEDLRSKYIISNNTDIFQKSLNLYGLYQCLSNIIKYKTVLIVEGNVDVISCYQEGIKITVSPFGTSFMKEHLLLLKQFADIFIFCLDADKGGEKSVVRIKKLMIEENVKAGFITLDKRYKDPDIFIKQNGVTSLMENIIDIRNELMSV